MIGLLIIIQKYYTTNHDGRQGHMSTRNAAAKEQGCE